MERNLNKISEADLNKHNKKAYDMLNRGSGSVKSTVLPQRNRRSVTGELITPIGSNDSQQSIINAITNIKKDDPLQTESQSHVIRVLRKALSISLYIDDVYCKQTKLGIMKENNASGVVENNTEFNSLIASSSLISLWVVSSYVLYKLDDYMVGSEFNDDLINKPTVKLGPKLLTSILSQYSTEVAECDSDEMLVNVTKQFFEYIQEEIFVLKLSCDYLDIFESNNFMVEDDDFAIQGFEKQAKVYKSNSIPMNKVYPHQIVGNKVAKGQAQRLAKMIALYDFNKKRNPILDVAGFPMAVLGTGSPGTGKTILFQMFCTLLSEYAAKINKPFNVTSFTPDDISSYQGKTAQTAKEKTTKALAPNTLGACLFDDIDQTTAHRSDDKASAGQKEVTAVIMETLAGASTVNYGNGCLFMFSNYPEKIDDALRQRAGMRWNIDGPISSDDFIDLTKILMGKNNSLNSDDYCYFSTQGIEQETKSFDEYTTPSDEKLLIIYNDFISVHGSIDTIEKVGMYLYKIKELDERFTGRAIKNVFDAVKLRTTNFDIPDEWFDDLSIYFEKSYDEKVALLKELVTPITPEIVMQEIHRYVQSELGYVDRKFEEDVKNYQYQMRVQNQAFSLDI